MNHAASMPSFLPMLTSLLIVLGLFAVAVWGLRRMGVAPRTGGAGPMRLISQLPLGPRERVVIVEVGDRWVLLGVGTGGITRLGTVAKGSLPAGPAPGPAFGALLERLRSGMR